MYDKEESLTQKSFVFSTSQNMKLKYVSIKKSNIASRYYSVAVITRDFDDGANIPETQVRILVVPLSVSHFSDKLFPVFLHHATGQINFC